MKLPSYKIISLSVLGSSLEYFDFTIYALFAHYISLNFFPQHNTFIALMNTFAVFAIGYLARPVGGVILGHIGDYYGRKYAFTYAMLVMASATLLIGCLPTYHAIGITAPILLVLLRLLQGLSIGGEVAGAITFTLEHYEKKRRGLMQALIIMGMSLSSTLAGLVGYTLINCLSEQAMLSWGWRIPFIFAFFLGLVGYVVRKNCTETPAFLDLVKKDAVCKMPFFTLTKHYPKQMLIGFCLAVMSACFASFLLFLPTYLAMHANFPANYGFAVSAIGFLMLGLVSLFSGALSDRVHYKTLFIISVILTVVSGYFAFHILLGLHTYTIINMPVVLAAIILLATAVGLSNGVYVIAIADQFPANVRYSGIGFCQNLSFALVGGTAPLIFTGLIHISKSLMAPYYYLVVCAVIVLITIYYYKPLTQISREMKNDLVPSRNYE